MKEGTSKLAVLASSSYRGTCRSTPKCNGRANKIVPINTVILYPDTRVVDIARSKYI